MSAYVRSSVLAALYAGMTMMTRGRSGSASVAGRWIGRNHAQRVAHMALVTEPTSARPPGMCTRSARTTTRSSLMFERLFGTTATDPATAERIPPGQYKTDKFPVLHYGSVPEDGPRDVGLQGLGRGRRAVHPDLGGSSRRCRARPSTRTSTASRAGRSSTPTGKASRSRRSSSWPRSARARPTSSPTPSRATRRTCRCPSSTMTTSCWPTPTAASRSSRSTATRSACSSRSATSGRAPSGSAASSSSTTTSSASGSATATTTTPTPGRKSASASRAVAPGPHRGVGRCAPRSRAFEPARCGARGRLALAHPCATNAVATLSGGRGARHGGGAPPQRLTCHMFAS